jgi:hypothetical protein
MPMLPRSHIQPQWHDEATDMPPCLPAFVCQHFPNNRWPVRQGPDIRYITLNCTVFPICRQIGPYSWFMSVTFIFALTIVLAVAGCSCRTESRGPSSAKTDETSSSAQTPVSYVPSGKPLAEVVTTEAWSAEADQAQHKRYGWPASFEVPIEYRMDVPETPAEIAEPSPPIETPK